MLFVLEEVHPTLVPFDYEAFDEATEDFVVGTTDVETGRPVYYKKGDPDFDVLSLLRASSSLPFFAPIVEYEGRKLMDGGIADPIPIRRAEADGCSRTVLILTRNEGYVKSRSRLRWLLRRKFGEYPKFVETMLNRHRVYNETVAYIEQQARGGAAFVVRPRRPIAVGSAEQSRPKLEALYRQGYEDAEAFYPELIKWLH